MPKFKWEILGDFQTMCDLKEVKKLINEFLPFVANADKIQNEQTKEWSDKEAWEALALLGVEVGVVGVEGLQTRTRSLAITSVASKSKKVLKAEGRHKDRADSNSRWIAKMLPSTVESLHSCNKKSNINFYFVCFLTEKLLGNVVLTGGQTLTIIQSQFWHFFFRGKTSILLNFL